MGHFDSFDDASWTNPTHFTYYVEVWLTDLDFKNLA